MTTIRLSLLERIKAVLEKKDTPLSVSEIYNEMPKALRPRNTTSVAAALVKPAVRVRHGIKRVEGFGAYQYQLAGNGKVKKSTEKPTRDSYLDSITRINQLEGEKSRLDVEIHYNEEIVRDYLS